MLEKLGGAAAMAGALVALAVVMQLELPLVVTIVFVLAGMVLYLLGVIFLFSDGAILKSPRRVAADSRRTLQEPVS